MSNEATDTASSEDRAMPLFGCSLTYSGRLIDLANPDPRQFDPVDIAVHLARTARFNGATSVSYSVAQHSVLAALLAPPHHKLAALLHDAAEAYLGDITRPVRQLIGGTLLAQLEENLEHMIGQRFGVAVPWHPVVREIDNRLLATEWRDLMPIHLPGGRIAAPRFEPYPERITPWRPRVALLEFLRLFEQLRGERVDYGLLPLRRKEALGPLPGQIEPRAFGNES